MRGQHLGGAVPQGDDLGAKAAVRGQHIRGAVPQGDDLGGEGGSERAAPRGRGTTG